MCQSARETHANIVAEIDSAVRWGNDARLRVIAQQIDAFEANALPHLRTLEKIGGRS